MIAAIHMFGGKHIAQSQIIYEIEHLVKPSERTFYSRLVNLHEVIKMDLPASTLV